MSYNDFQGICGRVIKVVDFKPLVPHHCGFKSCKGLCILSCEEAIQLACDTLGGSSQVPVCASNNASEGHLRTSSTNTAREKSPLL
jgi:hypothetical protein